MSDRVVRELLFWGVWLLIPLIIDILSGVMSALLISLSYKKKKGRNLVYMPYITVIVPVYNSAKTLRECIKSIAEQEYDVSRIGIILIDNGSVDNSYNIFCDIQREFKELKMWWITSSKGKAKALNKGLYAAEGQYILNIDSDGILHKSAVKNIVMKFQEDLSIDAVTGVILTNKDEIDNSESLSNKLVRKCELFEYIEAFLVGRNFQSKSNTMFTLAGAFSAFKKEAIGRTQLYNGETLGEDTHMTSQIRVFGKGKVVLCEDAFFFVDPVENIDKLYIQRQRWQRGQIEVSSLFSNKGRLKFLDVFKISMLRDHTLVFPRLMWIFAMAFLMFKEYPMELIVGSNIILYLAYSLNDLFQISVSKLYLVELKDFRSYINRNLWIVLILPLYRILTFFMRAAGIINASKEKATWNTKSFNEEKKIIVEEIKRKNQWYSKIYHWINNREESENI